MKHKESVKLILSALDKILEEDNFCKDCKNDHIRVISEKCDDCIAGMPLRFNYNQKGEEDAK